MSDLIDRKALYEQTAEWEASALHMVEKLMHSEDPDDIKEWIKWSAVLQERTAFKHDVADAPSAQPEPRWIPCNIPPNDDRSVFIAYSGGGLGTVCIGYYDKDDKCWREHRNWFASLLNGVKYWCEIPELPDGWKRSEDE